MDVEIHKSTGRFDRKLAAILSNAARVFAREGYGGASIRRVAAEAGVSLAGLYHYVHSKEELLYLIQLHTFEAIVYNLRDQLEHVDDPLERFRTAVRNHLIHFVHHFDELRVCALELDSLSGDYYDEVAAVRREYFRLMAGLVQALRGDSPEPDPRARLTTLSLFGSLNWLFQWYDPARDPSPEEMATEFTDLFMYGFAPRLGRGDAAGDATDG